MTNQYSNHYSYYFHATIDTNDNVQDFTVIYVDDSFRKKTERKSQLNWQIRVFPVALALQTFLSVKKRFHTSLR